MARRRSTRRRSLRSFGAVLVNAGGPRRRRRKNPPLSRTSVKGRTARATRKIRKAYTSKYKTEVSKYTRKGKSVRAHRRRRGIKGRRRKVHAWDYKRGVMRSSSKSSGIRRSRKARRNPAPVSRRRITRRRRSRARKNPAFLRGFQAQLKRIPVLGKFVLAPAVGLAPHAALGGLGAVEMAIQLEKSDLLSKIPVVGEFLKSNPHWFYAASGLTAALLVNLAHETVLKGKLDKSTSDSLQAALAAAGCGVGYFIWRQNNSLFGAVTLGQLSAGYAPVGAIAMSGPGAYGEGPAYTVSPMGGAMGAVVLG
jgi:hypothetical protein